MIKNNLSLVQLENKMELTTISSNLLLENIFTNKYSEYLNEIQTPRNQSKANLISEVGEGKEKKSKLSFPTKLIPNRRNLKFNTTFYLPESQKK